MSDIDILYHGDTQLLDWGESRSAGKWVRLRLSDVEGDPLAPFRGMDTAKLKNTGHILHVTIANGDIAQLAQEHEQEEDKLYKEQAARLHRTGFFRIPDVWRALGSDEDYQIWCRSQPCVICGDGDYLSTTGERRCEYMHIRRVANGSGTAIKPDYSGVPGCHKHHALQSNQGEFEAFLEHCIINKKTNKGYSVAAAKEWFDRKRIEHLERWAHVMLCRAAEIDSLSRISPENLKQVAERLHISKYLN